MRCSEQVPAFVSRLCVALACQCGALLSACALGCLLWLAKKQIQMGKMFAEDALCGECILGPGVQAANFGGNTGKPVPH